MWHSVVINYVTAGAIELLEKAKCGESNLSAIPTLLWAVGCAALANRLVTGVFRRFMFRRVPLWEVILQNLLFIWMIIYSLHFWVVLTNIITFFVKYCYETEDGYISTDDVEACKIIQQWILWMFSAIPLIVFIQTRPKTVAPPLMIWITTNPWQRREMGAYGYYLSRPFSDLQPVSSTSVCQQTLELRRAFSDSRTAIKESPKKRRNSKSV